MVVKSSHKLIGLLGILLFLTALVQIGIDTAWAQPDFPLDLEGTLNGAAFEIRVPENWNGTLLVYAHGYRDKADHPGEGDDVSADAAPGGDAMEAVLLAQGYALAGSAYRNNGWAVREGIADTLRLTQYFERHIATPDQVVLWGFSMGSVVAFKSIEVYPQVYDAAIPACAVGAGTSQAWDGAMAIGLAYDIAFGWDASWGTVGNVRDDIDFETEVAPAMVGQVLDPANFGRFEFMRLVSDLPAEDFYAGSNWLFTDMFFVTEARAELERRAHGPVAQNLTHHYSLTPAEKAYLSGLGVDAEALLAEMNAHTNIQARPLARQYAQQYADYTGDINRPVLTLHTTGDGLVPVSHEAAYRQDVAAAGKLNNLVQVYTDAVGHCAFTPEQLLSTVAAMDYWLATGIAPGPAFFPEALGFVPDFVPPDWPQP